MIDYNRTVVVELVHRSEIQDIGNHKALGVYMGMTFAYLRAILVDSCIEDLNILADGNQYNSFAAPVMGG